MILRGDPDLTPGKAAAKALQAGLNSFYQSPASVQAAYLHDGEGTQVILIAHCDELYRCAFEQAQAVLVPCVMYDEAIGIGPCRRAQVEHITQAFELYRDGSSMPERPPLKREDEGATPSRPPMVVQG